jgi:hypothetical protein
MVVLIFVLYVRTTSTPIGININTAMKANTARILTGFFSVAATADLDDDPATRVGGSFDRSRHIC